MTKEELNKVSSTNEEIKMWQTSLDKLKCQSLVKGQEISDMPFGSGTTDKVGNMSAEIVDIENIITGLLSRVQMERRSILEYIDSLSNSEIRQIIYYKCVSNINWFQVAKSMGEGYSADGVKQTYYRFLKKAGIN